MDMREAMTPPEPSLSLVMPAFNEQATILEAVGRVLEQPFVAELIIVDDASTDGTADLIATIDDPRVIALRHSHNQGKGAALRTGFARAQAAYVGIQDADLEYHPADYARLLAPLQNDSADVVYGSRFLTLMSNAVSNVNLIDMETCYKFFRREWIQSITIEENRFGFEPEITIKLARRGARMYEAGISYSGRNYEDGKKINWNDGVSAVRCIVKYGMSERRKRRSRAL
jgi:glycosyltransferase involved in cell wall biosynthesis